MYFNHEKITNSNIWHKHVSIDRLCLQVARLESVAVTPRIEKKNDYNYRLLEIYIQLFSVTLKTSIFVCWTIQ